MVRASRSKAAAQKRLASLEAEAARISEKIGVVRRKAPKAGDAGTAKKIGTLSELQRRVSKKIVAIKGK